VAKYNDVPLSMVRMWMPELAKTDSTGRGRPQKLYDAMRDFVKRRAEKEPRVVVDDLIADMAFEFDARVSASVMKWYVRELDDKRSGQQEREGRPKRCRKTFRTIAS